MGYMDLLRTDPERSALKLFRHLQSQQLHEEQVLLQALSPKHSRKEESRVLSVIATQHPQWGGAKDGQRSETRTKTENRRSEMKSKMKITTKVVCLSMMCVAFPSQLVDVKYYRWFDSPYALNTQLARRMSFFKFAIETQSHIRNGYVVCAVGLSVWKMIHSIYNPIYYVLPTTYQQQHLPSKRTAARPTRIFLHYRISQCLGAKQTFQHGSVPYLSLTTHGNVLYRVTRRLQLSSMTGPSKQKKA